MHDGLFDGGTYASSFSAPSATSTAPAAAGSAAAAAAAATTTGIKAEEDPLDKDSQPQNTQYLSPSCMLLTYFSGDIASNVDDHFSRSLSDNQGSSKGGSPSWKGKPLLFRLTLIIYKVEYCQICSGGNLRVKLYM